MKNLRQNLRYGLRNLRKHAGFTTVTVLTLALGIGANTAIFSVIDAALLRPLPYQAPNELLTVGQWRTQFTAAGETAYPDYLDWVRTAKSFRSFAGYGGDAFTMSAGSEPKNVFATQVTANFFATLGVKPVMGRDFVESDRQPSIPKVAILTYGFWRSEFQGDSNILGRVIRLDGDPVTIVGVLPPQFKFAPRDLGLWVPLHPGNDSSTRRSLRWLNVIGRLAPGVTPTQAQAEMNGITAQLARAYPKEDGAVHVGMGSLRDRIVGKIRPLLLVLLGAVAFVLLVACANVANLLMTRTIGRRKEFAVRAALGASRADLLSQSLVESLLLASLGAGVGMLCARWGVYLLVSAIPDSQMRAMPYLQDAGIDWTALLFLGGITILTALLFGVAPGLAASQMSPATALKDETRGGTSRAHARFRNSLVILEIATSVVLLAGAGLMLQSFRALVGQNPGFDVHHVLTFSVNLPDTSYPSDKTYPFNSPAALRFDHVFEQKLSALPGVQAVGAAIGVPATGGTGTIRFIEEGRPKVTGQEDECDIQTVTQGFFRALNIPLQAGRYFTEHDSLDAPPVVVVTQAFVRSYFPNENPLGKRVRFTFSAKETFRTIVGVSSDAAFNDLASPPPPVIFVPNDQGNSTYLSYMVRTATDPGSIAGAARTALHEMDPQLPMIQPRTLDQVAQQSPSVFLRRYPSFLIGSFAGLALLLAMVGLYGLISHSIAQRTRELGIRVTLGAQRRDILRLVLGEGLGAALAGTALGVAAGLICTRWLSSLLFGVTAYDWRTFAGVSALLLTVAIAACLLPARKATGVDPMVALRQE